MMVRTQIQLEESQHEQIRRLAHRNRISLSETVRRLVSTGLRTGLEESAAAPPEDILKLAGIGRSGVGDLGRRHDDYLDEDFAS